MPKTNATPIAVPDYQSRLRHAYARANQLAETLVMKVAIEQYSSSDRDDALTELYNLLFVADPDDDEDENSTATNWRRPRSRRICSGSRWGG